MIYFTSDLHFCHNQPFIYEPRGFSSVEQMNETIVNNFKNVLTENDELYILGDCILNDNKIGIMLLREIPGIKHIILGNHDTNTRIELYEQLPQTDVLGYATMFKYKKFIALLSHYPTLTGNYTDKKGHMVVNLCGHVHTKDKFYDANQGAIYHVEVDAHDCKPVSVEQIINDIKNLINAWGC